jgi:hypothetical protein
MTFSFPAVELAFRHIAQGWMPNENLSARAGRSRDKQGRFYQSATLLPLWRACWPTLRVQAILQPDAAFFKMFPLHPFEQHTPCTGLDMTVRKDIQAAMSGADSRNPRFQLR